jgi:hypothetical protein
MKKSAIAKWQMMSILSDYIELKGPEIIEVPQIQLLHQQLSTYLVEIESKAVQLHEQIGWIATRKKKLFTEIIETTMLFVGVAQSYALAKGNRELWLSVEVRKSDLTRKDRLTALNRCEAIKNTITPISTRLSDFGISKERYQHFVTQLNLALHVITEPRRAIAKRSGDIRSLYSLIEETFHMVRFQLDPVMKVFENVKPNVWREYQSHRKIIKPGYRSANTDDSAEDS